MIFKSYIFVCILVVASAYNQTYNISIQNTSQVYNAYIPYFDFCNYTNSQNIDQGNIAMFNITSQSVFATVQYADEYAFWVLIKDGMQMMVNQKSLVQGYDGIVIYNSQVYLNLTRHLILYEKNGSVLTFNYGIPFINQTDESVSANITQIINLEFNSQSITNFLSNCLAQDLIITAIPDQSFICSCKTLQSVFYWQENHQLEAIFQQKLAVNYPIQKMASNPAIYDGLIEINPFWSILIISGELQRNSSSLSTYFCDIKNKGNTSVIDCYQPNQNQDLINNVIDILWGSVETQQQFEMITIMQQVQDLQQLNFPGIIVSAYYNLRNEVYVETLDQNYNSYLIIISQNGDVYVNITFIGEIVYYGEEKVVVQKQIEVKPGIFNYAYYYIEITLPIYSISSEFYPNNYSSLQIECQYGITVNLQFNIVWSNIVFPSSLIQQINPLETKSFTQIISYDLANYFNVFGPAFQMYINDKNYDLQEQLFDSASFLLDQKILAIIDYVYILQKNKIFSGFSSKNVQSNAGYLLYTTQKGLFKHFPTHLNAKSVTQNNRIQGKPKIMQIRVKVCEIFPPYYGHKLNDHYYFYKQSQINKKTQTICQCNLLLTSCNQISGNQYQYIQFKFIGKSKAEAQINKNKLINYFENSKKQGKLFNETIGRTLQQTTQQKSVPKKYIVGHLAQQLLAVIIFTNNSVTLSNSSNRQALQTLNMNCSSWNNTNGEVFYKASEDPLLILYCQGTEIIYQYLIRKSQLNFIRKVPLYGFTSRKQGSFFVGSQYAFLEVDLALVGNAFILKVFNQKSCCVLRLEPTASTVSVIRQIVQIKKLSYIKSIFGVDIAYYNSSGFVHHGAQFVKVYYSSTILAINQTFRNAGVQTYYYEIIFVSPIYNFAAFYREQITFNLTLAQITYTIPPQGSQASLNFPRNPVDNQQPGVTVYNTSMHYNYGSVCGPILDTQFQFNATNQKLLINSNQIVTQTKILGKQGQTFIQIVPVDTPGPYPNWTLYNLILLVSSSKIEIYAKQFGVSYMAHISTIKTPENDCSYTLYQFLNQTAGYFITSCQTPNFHYKTPLLLLNFENKNVTYNFSTAHLPTNLQDIFVVIRCNSNLSYIIGLSEGPRGAITGKLLFCDIFSCSALFVSSKETYLVSYSAYNIPNQNCSFVIISLDTNKIQIWVNLNKTVQQIIPSNYSINLYPTITAQCGSIKIVSSTLQGAELILSSKAYYYQVYANFTAQTIYIMNKFIRYLNCDIVDQFRPKNVNYANGSLKILITQCSQKRQTLQLQEIQNYWQQETVTYTGYLQVFSFKGPQCGQNVYAPIKIVTLSSSMRNNLFEIYNIKGYDKLVFEKISGLLIDSFLSIEPFISVTIIPLTKVVQLPKVSMIISNQYYSTSFELLVLREPYQTQSTAYYFIAFFAILNLVTLVACIVWIALKYFKKIKNLIWSKEDLSDYQKNSNYSAQNNSQGQQPFLQKAKNRQVSQIQLFSHKIADSNQHKNPTLELSSIPQLNYNQNQNQNQRL